MTQKPIKGQRKNNTRNKNTTNKKTSNKKTANNVDTEIKSIIIIGVAFIIGLYIYTSIGAGSIGGFVKGFFVGLFGVGGYVLPIILFGFGGYIFFTKSKINSRVAILSSIIFISFMILTDIISGKVFVSASKAYSEASGFDGGLIGGGLANIFILVMGKVGTFIFVLVGIVISAMLLSGKSLIEQVNVIKEFFSDKFLREYEDDEVLHNERRVVEKKIVEKQAENRRSPSIEEEIEIKRKDDAYLKRKAEIEGKSLVRPKKPKIINLQNFATKKNKSKSEGMKVFDYRAAEERVNRGGGYIVKNYVEEPVIDEDATDENNNMKNTFFENKPENTIETNVNNEFLEDLEKQKNLVESLKEELDRQRFLCIETQNELIEQKKVEKSLLKIINAQRETIDKLTKGEEVKTNYEKSELKNEPTELMIKSVDYEQVKEEIEETKVEKVIDAEDIIDDSIEDDYFLDNYFYNEDINKELEENIISSYNDVLDDLENISVADEEKEIIKNINEISQDDLDNLRKVEEKVAMMQEKREILEEKSMPLPLPTRRMESREIPPEKPKPVYKYPTVDFLNQKPKADGVFHSKTELLENSKKLEATLKSFGVVAKVIEVNKGPTVTRYEVQPGLGVKVSKIANLSDDLALNLAAKGIRIQAPIPGKAAVGIEVPNDELENVYLREVLEDKNFKEFPSKLAFGIGKDIGGNIVVADLAKMPHLLVAGATGSGKSVCINTMITSIIYKSSPEEVKLLMIDPKVVELSVYNGIPHLLIPVVTDPKKASAALNWAVREMEKRYKLFADNNVRDLKGFNQHLIDTNQDGLEPQIVIIIDELADLMMTAAKEVEDSIMRLAAMARAAGIHLIIATQRPSVDVITGVIKSNIPSRLAFAVSSGVDSKTILDSVGAEKLLGKGDMLFSPAGSQEPMRIQGAFISDKEVESIVNFLKTDIDHDYMKEIIEDITSSSNAGKNIASDKVDELLEEVVEFIIDKQKASTSLIQRQFRVGFNRAARIVDELESFGVIGQEEGNKPRRVLMTKEEWDRKFKI